MLNCVKTPKGNRFDILDNRKRSIQMITGLNYAELEKMYREIEVELHAEHFKDKESFNDSNKK